MLFQAVPWLCGVSGSVPGFTRKPEVALEERLRSLELQAHGVCSDRDDLQSSAELAELVFT